LEEDDAPVGPLHFRFLPHDDGADNVLLGHAAVVLRRFDDDADRVAEPRRLARIEVDSLDLFGTGVVNDVQPRLEVDGHVAARLRQ
jgi:hypothetical protein